MRFYTNDPDQDFALSPLEKELDLVMDSVPDEDFGLN